MSDYETGTARHYRNFLKRLGAQRAEVRTPGGRDRLRAIREAAKPPKRKGLDMRPTDRSLVIVGLVLLLLVLFAVVAEADGANRSQTRAAICRVFGDRCGPALRVAACETGGTFNPYARGSAGERGLFQLHPVHFGWLDENRLYEPAYNARAAYRLSRGGRDWGHWSCRP